MTEAVGRILLTGATGFVGSHVLARFQRQGHAIRLLARRAVAGHETVIADISTAPDLVCATKDIDVVVHCAGYAHAFEEAAAQSERQHWLVNHEGALKVARAAAATGAKRFVFCSSVKAVGDPGSGCVDESFDALPESAYGKAKRKAEVDLRQLASDSGMELVILRPSMVYGPGGKGNLERMLAQVRKGMFPPLPDTGNRRSMVFIDDLVDAIDLAVSHPGAAGGCYHVAHPVAISGRALYLAMCAAVGREPAGWWVPASALRCAARMADAVGKMRGRQLAFNSQVLSRLLDSACYSSALLQKELGWRPRFGIAAGLGRLCADDARAAT